MLDGIPNKKLSEIFFISVLMTSCITSQNTDIRVCSIEVSRLWAS